MIEKNTLLQRIIAILFLLVLIRSISVIAGTLFGLIIAPIWQSYSDLITWIFTIVVLIGFIVFHILCVIGLWWNKTWAYMLAYLTIVYSTVFFSTNYLPLVSWLLPNGYSLIVIIMSNVTFMALLVYPHRQQKRRKKM